MVRKLFFCALFAVAGTVSTARADVTMTANACYQVGDLITVEFHKSVTGAPAVGAQFFLQYDTSALLYVGGIGGDPPFTFQILDFPSGANIDYAIGVPGSAAGVAGNHVVARLVFKAINQVCAGDELVRFRPHSPPSRLTDRFANDLGGVMHNLGPLTIDSTSPVITCPADVSVHADAGMCAAVIPGPGPATANDNCGPLTVAGTRSDSLPLTDPYPAGVTTTILWTATDCAGNADSCTQSVTVSTSNVLNATVELASVNPAPFTRCITFQLYNTLCPGPALTIDAPVTFTSGVGSVGLLVPCASGPYTCITARDRLHTLRRTANAGHFGIMGPNYVAAFVNGGLGNDDSLIGGNLNDDLFVDVLDFGSYIGQLGVSYGSGDTTCSTVAPHADINGDGTVNGLDFSFISIHFLQLSELNCCGTYALQDQAGVNEPGGPVKDVSVFDLAARGDWELARVSDLNRDGRLNLEDVIFLGVHGAARCGADYDGVNAVGIDDLFSFINGWFIGHPAADMNADRSVGIDDLFGYFNAWFVGCP